MTRIQEDYTRAFLNTLCEEYAVGLTQNGITDVITFVGFYLGQPGFPERVSRYVKDISGWPFSPAKLYKSFSDLEAAL